MLIFYMILNLQEVAKVVQKNPYKPLPKLALINILPHLLYYPCNFMNMIMYNEVIYSLL